MSQEESADESANVPLPNSDMAGADDPPVPLDYAAPPKSHRISNGALAAAGGAVLTILVVGWIGAINFPNLLSSYPPPPRSLKGITAFFMLAAFAIVATVALWRRRPLRPSGWFLLGMMIGLGIAGLLEGACWSAS